MLRTPAGRPTRPALHVPSRPAPAPVPLAASAASADLASALDASRRFGHRFADLGPAPAPQALLSPAHMPIQRGGNGDDEEEEEPMALDKEEFKDLKERAGQAMTKVVTEHQPEPGGKIDNLLDVLHMTHGYHAMHEEHNDPVEEPQAKEKEEEEEEEEEEEGEVVRKTVKPDTPSPYTHNTSMLFANLAQSYVHGVGAYEPNKKKDGASVSEYLGSAPKAIGPKGVLSLVSAPSFKSFNETFSAKVPEGDGADDARTDLWSISQLLDLESARRRAGGVMNAVGITQDLAEDKPDAKGRLVTKNVLSHKKASGKSIDPSPGKLERLQKSNAVMTALLSGKSNPHLDKLRKRMHSFVQQTPSHGSFGAAKKAWQQAARIDSKSMKLGVSKQLKEDADFAALKDDPSFKGLQGSFAEFMRGYYDPAKRATKAKEVDTRKSATKLEGDHFLTWMINKAASAAHQQVLSEESAPHGLLPKTGNEAEPQRRHEASEFLTMFGANQDPQTATKRQHVANLRRAYEMSKESEVFGKSRLHANNRGRHFRPGFGRYENLSAEVVKPLEQVYSAPLLGLGEKMPREMEESETQESLEAKAKAAREETHQMIRAFVAASSKGEFGSTSHTLKQKMDDYEKTYAAKEEELYQGYGLGKGARMNVQKRVKLRKTLGIKDNELLEGGVDDFRPRVKDYAKFRALHPKEARKSARALAGLRDVYRGLETDRDHTGGAMNEILREEGFHAKDEPLDPTALFATYNIMSPPKVNTAPEVKEGQYRKVRRNVKLKGPLSQRARRVNKKRKELDPSSEELQRESQQLDEELQGFFRKKLRTNDGKVIAK